MAPQAHAESHSARLRGAGPEARRDASPPSRPGRRCTGSGRANAAPTSTVWRAPGAGPCGGQKAASWQLRRQRRPGGAARCPRDARSRCGARGGLARERIPPRMRGGPPATLAGSRRRAWSALPRASGGRPGRGPRVSACPRGPLLAVLGGDGRHGADVSLQAAPGRKGRPPRPPRKVAARKSGAAVTSRRREPSSGGLAPRPRRAVSREGLCRDDS